MWFVLGALLGPLGVICSAIWSGGRRCQFCQARLHQQAIVCAKCGRDVGPAPHPGSAAPGPSVVLQRFPGSVVQAVWDAAATAPGYLDVKDFRVDYRGAVIDREHYLGDHAYGWLIEQVVPSEQGGTDDVANLRAVHHKNCRLEAGGKADWG